MPISDFTTFLGVFEKVGLADSSVLFREDVQHSMSALSQRLAAQPTKFQYEPLLHSTAHETVLFEHWLAEFQAAFKEGNWDAPSKHQLNLLMLSCTRAANMPQPGCGLARWLQSDATGLSSMWMARCYVQDLPHVTPPHASYAYPQDSDDFSRCAMFVESIGNWGLPEHRKRLAESGPEWAAIMAKWDWLMTASPEQQGAFLRTL
jgi:hypothetical protein